MATSTTRRTSSPIYSGPYAALVNSSARANGIDPWWLAGLLYVENRFRPTGASSAGAEGIAQILLSAHPDVSKAEADNPAFAIPWAARYLGSLKRRAGGSITTATAWYNTGPNASPAVVSGAGTAYVDQVRAASVELKKTLGKASMLAGGFLRPGSRYQPGRADHGRDFQTDPGAPLIAPGNGRVVAVKSDPGGFGGSYPVVAFSTGPYAGKTLYLGHTLSALAAGARFKVGQVLAHTGTSPVGSASVPGWAEIGYGVPGTGSYGVGGPPFGGTAQEASFFSGLGAASGVFGDVGRAADIGGAAKGTTDALGAVYDLITNKDHRLENAMLWLLFMLVGFALLYLGVTRLFGVRPVRDVVAPTIGALP